MIAFIQFLDKNNRKLFKLTWISMVVIADRVFQALSWWRRAREIEREMKRAGTGESGPFILYVFMSKFGSNAS